MSHADKNSGGPPQTAPDDALSDLRTRVVRLSAQDQLRFAAALLDPEPLTPAMERAVARYRSLIEHGYPD